HLPVPFVELRSRPCRVTRCRQDIASDMLGAIGERPLAKLVLDIQVCGRKVKCGVCGERNTHTLASLCFLGGDQDNTITRTGSVQRRCARPLEHTYTFYA